MAMLDRVHAASHHSLEVRPSIGAESPAVAELLDKVLDWTAFDVFALARLSGGRPLQLVTLRLLSMLGLVQRLRLSAARLASFLAAVEASYGPVPYHNSTHAADVTQALGAMIALDAWAGQLNDWEALAVVVAAAVHDLGHPGVNNDFHRRTRSAAAARHQGGGGGVNECGHAELALDLLAAPQNDFLADADAQAAAAFRALLKRLVLLTDMACHGDLVAAFRTALERWGGSLADWPPDARPAALCMLLHCADISNPARPLEACKAWGRMVQAELFAQGDRERGLGLDVTPACDRHRASPPRSQAGFIRQVMWPSFAALAPLAPQFVATVEPFVAASLEYWQQECSTGEGCGCRCGAAERGSTSEAGCCCGAAKCGSMSEAHHADQSHVACCITP